MNKQIIKTILKYILYFIILNLLAGALFAIAIYFGIDKNTFNRYMLNIFMIELIVLVVLLYFLTTRFEKKINENEKMLKEHEDKNIKNVTTIEKARELYIQLQKDYNEIVKKHNNLYEELVNKKDEEIENQKKKLTVYEKIEKGKNFEKQVLEFFNINGYETEHRGIKKGKKDKGIDILAKKDNVYYLIQCKNFAPTTKIEHKLIKEFNSNCLDFLNLNNEKLNRNNTKFILVISNRDSLKENAIHYIRDTNNKCEFMEITYKEVI